MNTSDMSDDSMLDSTSDLLFNSASGSMPSSVISVGHDVVDIKQFSAQCEVPGSRFLQFFSAKERRQAHMKANQSHSSEYAHLAVRWAGKESFLKAWSQALEDDPHPYTIENFPWNGIEILVDARSRPYVELRPDVLQIFEKTLGSIPKIFLSLSHDGMIASAVVIFST